MITSGEVNDVIWTALPLRFPAVSSLLNNLVLKVSYCSAITPVWVPSRHFSVAPLPRGTFTAYAPIYPFLIIISLSASLPSDAVPVSASKC